MTSIVNKMSKFTKREIDYLFDSARSVLKNQFCTILLTQRQKEFGRVLIITSRKVGNAPERNLVRRRIKSIFYQEKLFESPFDWVIITKQKIVMLPFEQLKDLLLGVLQKAVSQ